MLSADHAKKALEYKFKLAGQLIQVGNPNPYSYGFDNYTGGSASLSNFNNLMRGGGTFGLGGVFGSIGAPQNLTSNFPNKNSTWVGTSLTITGGGLTATWVGTAVTLNDVVIEITIATLLFTGTIGGYGTISGVATVSMGVGRVQSGSISIPTLFTNIFYGKICWGMTNDNLGAMNYQILVNSFFDLLGNDYSVTLNSTKTLGLGLVTNDSLQGELTGTASNIFFADKCNIYLDGFVFPIKPT